MGVGGYGLVTVGQVCLMLSLIWVYKVMNVILAFVVAGGRW